MSENDSENICGYEKDRNGEPCQRVAGWGTDHVGTGRCTDHPSGGAPEGNDNAEGNSGGAAPEGNTNAVTHGAYADQSSLYTDVFSDAEREIADGIFADYRDRYKREHARLPKGDRIRIFKIAVNAVSEFRVEAWNETRPDKQESGTIFIDREETKKVAEHGGTITQIKYRKSPALAAKKALSNENRRWLKDLGLLDDPQSKQAEQTGSLADAISSMDPDKFSGSS